MTRYPNNQTSLPDQQLKVLPPLKAQTEDKRRFVRLEIISPVNLHCIRNVFGGFFPDGNYDIHASILNLSDGGVLLESDSPLNEGDIVAMRFTVPDVAPLDGVLGLVKRCDPDESTNLIGIQFVNRQDLSDILSEVEMELLPRGFTDFSAIVRKVLNEYLELESK